LEDSTNPSQLSSRLHFSQMIWLHSFWACFLYRRFYCDQFPHHQVHIESHRTWTQRNYFPIHIRSRNWFAYRQFPSMYRKLSCGNVYKSCCCMGILISSLYPNVVLANGLYVWISILTMRSSKISPRFIHDVENVSHFFRCFAPQILKIVEMQNSTR